MVFIPCFHPISVIQPDEESISNGYKQVQFFDKKKGLKFARAFDFNTGHLLPYEDLVSRFPEYNIIQIPCKKCLGCRLDKSKEWSVRNVLESLSFDNNFFITLTLDDDNVLSEVTYEDEFSGSQSIFVPTLRKKDVQDFMKNLRRYFEYHYNHTGIRYFACGEYGSTTNRPHYHILVYNCPIQDLQYYKSSNGSTLFNSDALTKIWNKGHVVIAPFSYETAAYVSRYVLKKVNHDDVDYKALHLHPEFIMMSTKPGIGRKYYDEHKDMIYNTDELFICDSTGKPISCKPVEYYDTLFEVDNPEDYRAIKDKRLQNCKLSQVSELAGTSLSRDKYLAVKENNLFAKLRTLQRN